MGCPGARESDSSHPAGEEAGWHEHVRAVDEGASRREGAVRFGVSAASAVRWCALAREGESGGTPRHGSRGATAGLMRWRRKRA